MGLTIGVDVGGTKIAAGVVDADGTLLAEVRRATPADDPAGVGESIAAAITEVRAAHPVTAVGIGAAGMIDRARARVMFAPNVAWRDFPLKDLIETRTGLPTVLENDANAAAWAEYRFGAGQGVDDLVVVTLGTGIGGGIIVDRQLLRGAHGFAAEIGHIEMQANGRRCGCGRRGCWERYGSGTALVQEARELARFRPGSAARLLELAGGDPDAVQGHQVTRAAREGDPAAREIYHTVGTWVGRGLADLAAIFDPGRFVLAGGLGEVGDLLWDPAAAAFAENLTGRDYRPLPEIRIARLGGGAGMIGAADLARAANPQAGSAVRTASAIVAEPSGLNTIV
ncbi:ROK family glucokinase [Granulicoccus phenolivorans]|uniref:ROK family glucokinase n=1 Tax=Granulicoccus phenolivorans TaxID=266854 RepID=UPI00042278C3|nr:ROK family glucokinase [Granulicoccus phenolivorans]